MGIAGIEAGAGAAAGAAADAASCCTTLTVGLVATILCLAFALFKFSRNDKSALNISAGTPAAIPESASRTLRKPAALVPALRNRRSVFPRHYVNETVSKEVMERLLEAAMWAPFHGPVPPWHFVVLGRKAMVEMQQLTLRYYDENWRQVGWGDGSHGTEQEYLEWRDMTEKEIAGRWGPVSYMVAIVMRRQAGSKRIPEWEEAAATACAVHNMHIQASAEPGLACYWSSWHRAVRNSPLMHEFLQISPEDKCLGYFIVARCKDGRKDNRHRVPEIHLSTQWRA